jgi:hypothetical protein
LKINPASAATLTDLAMEAYLPGIARTEVRPGVRAAAFRCLIERRATCLESYGREWVDKPLGISCRMPVLGGRHLNVAPSREETIALASAVPVTDQLRPRRLRHASQQPRHVLGLIELIMPNGITDLFKQMLRAMLHHQSELHAENDKLYLLIQRLIRHQFGRRLEQVTDVQLQFGSKGQEQTIAENNAGQDAAVVPPAKPCALRAARNHGHRPPTCSVMRWCSLPSPRRPCYGGTMRCIGEPCLILPA